MKLQVLFFNKYGHAQVIADKLSSLFRCKCDQIPPAYQCNKEKLVFIAYEKHGALDKKFLEFLKEMDTNKTANVALIEISKTGNEGFDELRTLFNTMASMLRGPWDLRITRASSERAR
ncbi:MAG: hypothetical protein ACLTDS_08110 [Bianqueaceae bacterium]